MSESPITGRCQNFEMSNQNVSEPESVRIFWNRKVSEYLETWKYQNLMVSESERVRIIYTWKVLKSTKSWVFEISDSDTFMFLSASRSGRAQSEFQRLLHRDVWRVPTHACFGWQYSAVLCPQDWLRFPLHWIWWAKVSIAICCEFLWDIRIMCNDSFYTSDSPILSC